MEAEPIQKPVNYASLDKHCRQLLRFRHISERQRLIAEVILDHSYAVGQSMAHIDTLSVFTAWTGIDPKNVQRIAQELDRLGVIKGNTRTGEYIFLPDDSSWQTPRRRVSQLVHHLVFERLLATSDSLAAALGEVSREAALSRPAFMAESAMKAVADSAKPMADSATPLNRVNEEVLLGSNRLSVAESAMETTVDETYWLQEIGKLTGKPEIERNGGCWRTRLREHPAAVINAVAATKLQRDSSGFTKSAARYMNRCYQNERKGRKLAKKG